MVVSQVALSVVLVVAAGVFVRALEKATSLDPGFELEGIEVAGIDLSFANYGVAAGQQFFSDLMARARQVPGVQDVSIAAGLPISGPARYGRLTRSSPRDRDLSADWNVVSPHYFSTLRIALLAGRDFIDGDTGSAPAVMIVSEEAARRYWPGQDPIGQTMLVHATDVRRGDDATPRTVTVVGVVRDVKSRLSETPRAQVYLPLPQRFVSRASLIVRTTSGQRVAASLRALVASVNPDLPITSQTLAEAAVVILLPQRVAAAVSGGLGLVGLLLAMMGIYGVTAFAVATRTREIGIRVALGATYASVVALMLRVGMALVAIGGAIGAVVAFALNVTLTRVFFGFPPVDLAVLSGAAALFAAIGVVACYVPVRRAARVDPAIALRVD
jgi:predicted permease